MMAARESYRVKPQRCESLRTWVPIHTPDTPCDSVTCHLPGVYLSNLPFPIH